MHWCVLCLSPVFEVVFLNLLGKKKKGRGKGNFALTVPLVCFIAIIVTDRKSKMSKMLLARNT